MCAGTGPSASSGSNPLSWRTIIGFSAKELNRIRKIVIDNLDRIREAWDEHCGQQ